MIYLLLSILFTTLLVIILRMYDKWNIETEYGITFNYLFCVITGFIAMPDKLLLHQVPEWNGWYWCLLLGVGFILIFLLIGKSTTLLGVATTGVAFKLSFIIPVIIALLFYGDTVTITKIIGILLAIGAVILIAYPSKNETTNSKIDKRAAILPILIFVGSGLTDASFNFIQRNYTPPHFEHVVTIMVFAGAFIGGMLLYGTKKELYQKKNVIAGIVLGIPNYFSLFFLMQALNHSGFTPSTLFPINNLCVVGLSALVGFIVFKEKMDIKKITGILLAIASIVLIGFMK